MSFAYADAGRRDTGFDLRGQTPRKDFGMKVLGKYPRLAVLAFLVSLAVASGAIKKWN